MPVHESDDEAGDGDQERRPEAVPEPAGERDRSGVVVLEAEPAGMSPALDAPRVSGRLPEVDQHVRARGGERDDRERGADRQASPPPPRGRDERREEDDPRVFRACREPDREPGELDPARDHQRERDRDADRQRHVGDGHARVGDVRRLDSNRGRGDEARDRPVRRASQPPRGRDSPERNRDQDDPCGQVRGLVLPRLERREQVHDEGRIVEPVRVEPAAVRHRPGARDDVPLVGVQERKRKAVPDADEPERSGQHEQRRERDPRAAPPVDECVRPLAGPHEPGLRGCARRRSRRPLRRARARRSRRGS